MSEGPELVLGLVGAIGTDLRAVSEVLQRQLSAAGYGHTEIRVSRLLHDIGDYVALSKLHDMEQYYVQHMDKGNEVRKRLKRADAMALLALVQLRSQRREKNEAAGVTTTSALSRHAFIINSLKRPEEIELLKEVYGDAFVLLGAYASRDTRRDTLSARIAKSQNKESEQCRDIAERLIGRDESEAASDEQDAKDYGQDVGETYFKADAFVDASEKGKMDDSVRRFVDVLFGHPFETPTRDELGMQHAFSAALRSADLSRQVGAAICTNDGQILAVGTNDVPKAGGGLYWSGAHDYRDFRFAETDEPNAEMKLVILSDLLDRLKVAGTLASGIDLDDGAISEIAKKLKGSRLMKITEYGRAVHSEMAAITDAARRGVSIQDATLYCTTFPCHNCAKHIVAAGIRQVIYIEPYPKSQVGRLFWDSIAVDRKPSENQVSFSSFVGFAPTRFADFFIIRSRVDQETKKILTWDEIKGITQPRVFGIPAAYLIEELTKNEELKEAMKNANMEFARKGGDA